MWSSYLFKQLFFSSFVCHTVRSTTTFSWWPILRKVLSIDTLKRENSCYQCKNDVEIYTNHFSKICWHLYISFHHFVNNNLRTCTILKLVFFVNNNKHSRCLDLLITEVKYKKIKVKLTLRGESSINLQLGRMLTLTVDCWQSTIVKARSDWRPIVY